MHAAMPSRQRRRSSAAALLLVALALATAPAAAAPAAAATASSANFAAAARSVDPGGQLTVNGYVLEGDTQASTMVLERFEVWAPRCKVWVQAAANAPPRQVPCPTTRYFKGVIAGRPGSSVVLSVRPNGAVTGTADRGNSSWALGKDVPKGAGAAAAAAAAAAPLRSRRVVAGAQTKPPFQCGTVRVPNPAQPQPGPARKLLQVRPRPKG